MGARVSEAEPLIQGTEHEDEDPYFSNGLGDQVERLSVRALSPICCRNRHGAGESRTVTKPATGNPAS